MILSEADTIAAALTDWSAGEACAGCCRTNTNQSKNRRRAGCRNHRRSLLDVVNAPGDLAETVPRRSIHPLRARQEGMQESLPRPGRNIVPRVQPEGVAVPGSSGPDKASERRKRPARQDVRSAIAGAAANARCLDPEPAEGPVETSRPIPLYGSDPVTVRTDPAGFGNCPDLVEQDCMRPAPKRTGQATKTPRRRRSILKGRLNDDAHVQGRSPFTEPPTYTDTPVFCPLPIQA